MQFARCDSVGLPNAHDKAGVSLKWWSQGSAPTGLSAAHNNHCIDSQKVSHVSWEINMCDTQLAFLHAPFITSRWYRHESLRQGDNDEKN